MGYRALAATAARSERVRTDFEPSTVAAGWEDARDLGVKWLPILLQAEDRVRCAEDPAPAAELRTVFVGTLDYAPNVDAVERLCRSIWPRVLESVPHAVLTIAGRRPSPRVVDAAKAARVRLAGPFENPTSVYSGSMVSVAPLTVSTGFQIKVLDAAKMGVAQVVTPAALRGFAPGFPARVASDDEGFASSVVDLLQHPDQAQKLAAAAREHVQDRYAIARWADEVRTLIR
jgi:polysaccharide biosynthesis protein PslH